MTKAKLSADDRRAIVLAALVGKSQSEIAREYGVTRQYVHEIANEAIKSAIPALIEAEKEYKFRRVVAERCTRG